MDYSRLARRLARACQSAVEELLAPVEEADLDALEELGVPPTIRDFYEEYAPTDTIELNDIRLWAVPQLIEENRTYAPGAEVHDLGYVVIAGNRQGDVYCLDLGPDADQDPPAVVLLPRDVRVGALDRQLVEGQARPVADSFDEFLLEWARGTIVG